jgi:hypothetical protein
MNYSSLQSNEPKYIVSYSNSTSNDNFENQKQLIESNVKQQKQIPKKNDIFQDIYNPTTLFQKNQLNKEIPEKRTLQQYDPYIGFLEKQGVLNYPTNSKYKNYILNVDSSKRRKNPANKVETPILLDPNPLLFTKNSNEVTIKVKNHTFEVNDKIILEGIIPKVVKLTSIGLYNKESYVSKVITDEQNRFVETTVENKIETRKGSMFEMKKNSKYMKFNYTHFIPIQNEILINIRDVTINNDPFIETFDLTNLYVEINDIRGNKNNQTYYNNIPVNMINRKHKVILKDPETNKVLQHVFFIELPFEYISDGNQFEPPEYRYVFTLSFYYLSGVPINYLNANYPINLNRYKGFHNIINKTNNTITIELNSVSSGFFDEKQNKLSNGYCGGPNISIAKIISTEKGYPYSNRYAIELEQTLTNIISMKLLSSEFINADKLIKAFPSENQNNIFYWQNLDDGNHVYSVELTEGNYDKNSLIKQLKEKIANTLVINSTNQYNYIEIDIDLETDTCTFKSFKKIELFRPIVSIVPDITTDSTSDPKNNVTYMITIYHPNHSLQANEVIILSNAIEHMGIPESILNRQHKISQIIDKDHYSIELPSFNLSQLDRRMTQGGNIVSIIYPNKFRIRFDYTDTFGSILGFRNVGNSNAITKYDTVLSNKNAYDSDVLYDEVGSQLYSLNKRINFFGDQYILIACKQLETMLTMGSIKNVFGKILLNGESDKPLYNTFVPVHKIFDVPVPEISELEFEFYNQNGNLYDFYGTDHSFTLELITLNESPEISGISARTGRMF